MPVCLAALTFTHLRKLVPWFLRQPRKLAPNSRGGNPRSPQSLSWFCTRELLAWRRGQLCVALAGPVWILTSRHPAVRHCSEGRAVSLSLCWSLTHSHCSSGSWDTDANMSSPTSSSISNGQGKNKTKPPFRKRASLQINSSSGEYSVQNY